MIRILVLFATVADSLQGVTGLQTQSATATKAKVSSAANEGRKLLSDRRLQMLSEPVKAFSFNANSVRALLQTYFIQGSLPALRNLLALGAKYHNQEGKKIEHRSSNASNTKIRASFLLIEETVVKGLQAQRDDHPLPEANKFSKGVFVGVEGTIIATAYYFLKNQPRQGNPRGHNSKEHGKHWRFSLFSCFDAPWIAMASGCCGAARWADTIRLTGLLSFWAAYLLMVGPAVGFNLLSFIVPQSGMLLSTLLICVMICFRQQIRRMFDMPHGDCSTIAEDCATYTCCGCCALVQEARQVEDAYETNHPVVQQMMSLQASHTNHGACDASKVFAPAPLSPD